MYVALIEDKGCEHEETWIEELQRSFGDAMEKEVSYVESKAAAGKKAMDEERLQETTKKDQEKVEKMVQQMIIKRKTSEIVFQQLVEDVKPVLEMDCITAALKKAQEGLDAAVADCKEANDKYLELLDKDKGDAEFNWMKNIQKEYNAITSRIAVGIAKEQEKLKKLESTSKSKESCNLRLEKLKMPTFDGDIRQYPRFKKDFEQQVLPGLPKESALYALRSCLVREPLSIVRSVEDDIEEMLKRLDEKYGDPAKIADAVIESIKEVKVIKEGEHKRFINFVNIVEDAYQDLRRLGLEKEITTTSSVSIIEKKLPNDVRKEWAKLVSFDFPRSFKTKRKFWLHDGKVHGLIETSSEESDSEMVAGHEERVRSTRINMTDTRTDVRNGGDIRGDRMDWRLGRVSKFQPGNDRKVRNVEVQYKNRKSEEPLNKYGGQDYGTVERAVHRLVVILPAYHDDK
ncbi:Hypothetical predicted protein [Paramuricea clavata]|uniref:Uncharacterized protein n=1 Tax=Paramuricea clavata TaxID=317549 RepID=A0A6S7JB46_PARCT|nr:Hypothetical predicted protein [Paramuricea clavata]